jgi:molybdopterin-synthase adenylyltransferase
MCTRKRRPRRCNADRKATSGAVSRLSEALGLGVEIKRIRGDVREEGVFRKLLDTDVVLAGTDTHASRAMINELASTYLLPVIDVGVRAGAKGDGRLAALAAEVRTVTPATPCLWCRDVISADVVRAENLPPKQREQLLEEGYLPEGVGEPAPSVVALTFLGASLATCALITLLSDEGEVAPAAILVDGLVGYGQEMQPTEPQAGCRCRGQIGLGDAAAPPFRP